MAGVQGTIHPDRRNPVFLVDRNELEEAGSCGPCYGGPAADRRRTGPGWKRGGMANGVGMEGSLNQRYLDFVLGRIRMDPGGNGERHLRGHQMDCWDQYHTSLGAADQRFVIVRYSSGYHAHVLERRRNNEYLDERIHGGLDCGTGKGLLPKRNPMACLPNELRSRRRLHQPSGKWALQPGSVLDEQQRCDPLFLRDARHTLLLVRAGNGPGFVDQCCTGCSVSILQQGALLLCRVEKGDQ